MIRSNPLALFFSASIFDPSPGTDPGPKPHTPPSLSIFVNTFLLGQLDEKSYKRFGWWTLAVVGIYLVYGVFAAQAKDDEAKWVEAGGWGG